MPMFSYERATKPKIILCIRLVLLFIVVVFQIFIEFLKMYTLFVFRCHHALNIYHLICIFFHHSSRFLMPLHFKAHIWLTVNFLFSPWLTSTSLVIVLLLNKTRTRKENNIAGKRTEERLIINVLCRAYGYHKNYSQCQTFEKVKIKRFQWIYENEVDVTKTSTYAQDKQVTNCFFFVSRKRKKTEKAKKASIPNDSMHVEWKR